MKNNDSEPVLEVIRQIFTGPLTNPDAIHLAAAGQAGLGMSHGFHCHTAWELFCPLRAVLQFCVAGSPPTSIPPRHLLIVPPGCQHLAVDRLSQSKKLTLFVMNLPDSETPYGGIFIGSERLKGRSVLSPTELGAWAACIGFSPGAWMDQIALALGGGEWGRERALGMLRVLVSAYATVVSDPQRDPLSLNAHRVAEARLFLESHYYEQELSVEMVAHRLGVSASHLAFLFREETGRTLHQTLIELRMQRSIDLLRNTTLSIKEIASLTGWNHQLYFSAAFRKHYLQPPSAVRKERL